MKTIKEKFHKQISKNYKENLFARKRKQLQFVLEMNTLYSTIIENNLDLMLLIKQYGYANFYKYCYEIVDNRLLIFVLNNQNSLITNLEFFQNLICLDLLCEISIIRFFFLLSNILTNYLQNSKLIKVIENVKCLLKKVSYHKITIQCIKNHKTLDLIFDIIIKNQKSGLIYSLIQLQKATYDLQCINVKKLIHCLQVHILTSSDQNQLYQTYKFLGEIFDILYTTQDDLSQYGSIINKMFNDVEIQILIQPISLFLIKGIKNHSILKILISMGTITNLSSLIINIYTEGGQYQNQNQGQILQNYNKVSIFSQQSLWRLLKTLIEQYIRRNEQKFITSQIQWKKLKNIIINLVLSKQLYVKSQLFLLMESISMIKDLKNYFSDIRSNMNMNNFNANGLVGQVGQSFQYTIKGQNELNFPQNFKLLSLENQKQQR